MKGFRSFILRGSVVDLAVGIVVGAAFGAVITKLVEDLITPIIGAVGGQPDFSRLTFTVHHSHFKYGDFINAIVAFLLIAAAVYFFVVLPVNRLMTLFKPVPDEPTETRECPRCLSTIPQAATRCAFCTSEIEPVGAESADAKPARS
jgi:large conductance mechanosensitive channel